MFFTKKNVCRKNSPTCQDILIKRPKSLDLKIVVKVKGQCYKNSLNLGAHGLKKVHQDCLKSMWNYNRCLLNTMPQTYACP